MANTVKATTNSCSNCLPQFQLDAMKGDFCDNRTNIVVAEGKVSYRADNQNKHCCCRYKVDGGLIASTKQRKCDYLVANCTQSNAYLIELKGGNLDDAAEQILITLSELKLPENYTVYARIVLTKFIASEADGTNFIKLLRKFGNRLKHQTRELKESF